MACDEQRAEDLAIMRDDPTSDEAGMERYVKAGEQLNEAKTLPRFKDGGFVSWG